MTKKDKKLSWSFQQSDLTQSPGETTADFMVDLAEFPTKRLNPVAGRAAFETRFYHSIQDPFAKFADFVATTWQKQEKKIAETLSR